MALLSKRRFRRTDEVVECEGIRLPCLAAGACLARQRGSEDLVRGWPRSSGDRAAACSSPLPLRRRRGIRAAGTDRAWELAGPPRFPGKRGAPKSAPALSLIRGWGRPILATLPQQRFSFKLSDLAWFPPARRRLGVYCCFLMQPRLEPTGSEHKLMVKDPQCVLRGQVSHPPMPPKRGLAALTSSFPLTSLVPARAACGRSPMVRRAATNETAAAAMNR